MYILRRYSYIWKKISLTFLSLFGLRAKKRFIENYGFFSKRLANAIGNVCTRPGTKKFNFKANMGVSSFKSTYKSSNQKQPLSKLQCSFNLNRKLLFNIPKHEYLEKTSQLPFD